MSRHDVYDALVVVHAAAAVVAFGAIALSGVYGSTATRGGRPGAMEEVRRYFASPSRAAAAVVGVAPIGAVALAVDPRGPGFAHAWVAGGLVLWLIASALWLAVVRPAEAAIARAVGAEASPVGSQALTAAGRRIARASGATDLIFVAALALMVFQPG